MLDVLDLPFHAYRETSILKKVDRGHQLDSREIISITAILRYKK